MSPDLERPDKYLFRPLRSLPPRDAITCKYMMKNIRHFKIRTMIKSTIK